MKREMLVVCWYQIFSFGCLIKQAFSIKHVQENLRIRPQNKWHASNDIVQIRLTCFEFIITTNWPLCWRIPQKPFIEIGKVTTYKSLYETGFSYMAYFLGHLSHRIYHARLVSNLLSFQKDKYVSNQHGTLILPVGLHFIIGKLIV